MQSIIRNAQSAGFWSIWFTIFENIPDVRKSLIENFAGTANCFDENFNPIPRNYNDLKIHINTTLLVQILNINYQLKKIIYNHDHRR